MNILVTGGAGYIGAHTCKILKSKNLNPIVFDNFKNGNLQSVKWGPYVEGDVRNSDDICRAIKNYNIKAVVHFAALAYVGESVRDPLSYYENNVGGMTQLLKAMTTCGVNELVFSSSCATYGIPLSTPIREEAEQKPINPYGRTKLISEQMAREFHVAYGIRTISLRYFNAAGADADLEVGELHEPETHIIPLAIRAAHNREPLQIFGNDYPTADGTCIRDYIHVTDLAAAHVAALQKLHSGEAQLEYLNLGTGKGYSVLEVAKEVELSVGQPLQLKFSDRRQGDPPVLVADATRATQYLNWQCENSSLKNIIHTANQFHLLSQKKTRI